MTRWYWLYLVPSVALARDWIPRWGHEDLLGFERWQWIGLLGAIVIGLVLKTVVEWCLDLVARFSTRWGEGLRHQIFVSLEAPAALIVASGFWFFSVHYLKFEGMAADVLLGMVKVILGAALIWVAYRLSNVAEAAMSRWAAKTDNDLDDLLVPLVGKSLRIFVIIFGVLILVQNLGFNVMSLLAGLGLGGLAFALAAKDTAANFFGSLMILLDRPFTVGDWIKSTDVEGTVEDIGFRSTRIRTFYNSQISIPNSILATTNIDNMGRREYRRVKAVLGITYDTSAEKMEAFLEGIKNIIKANPNTRKDYYHVVFDSYGDFSLNVLVYFFLKVPGWADELVERQNVYLEILRLAKDLKVEFAFPTRTLHMESFPEKQPTRAPTELERSEYENRPKGYGPGGPKSHPSGLGLFTPPYKES